MKYLKDCLFHCRGEVIAKTGLDEDIVYADIGMLISRRLHFSKMIEVRPVSIWNRVIEVATSQVKGTMSTSFLVCGKDKRTKCT